MAGYGPLTRDVKGGELVVHEESIIYCRDSGTVQNAEVGATDPTVTDDPVGLPLKTTAGQYQFATAAEVTTGTAITGIIIYGPPITTALAQNDISIEEYAILKQGPAVINEGRIPANDAFGSAITAADYIAALANLNIDSIPISPTRETQST